MRPGQDRSVVTRGPVLQFLPSRATKSPLRRPISTAMQSCRLLGRDRQVSCAAGVRNERRPSGRLVLRLFGVLGTVFAFPTDVIGKDRRCVPPRPARTEFSARACNLYLRPARCVLDSVGRGSRRLDQRLFGATECRLPLRINPANGCFSLCLSLVGFSSVVAMAISPICWLLSAGTLAMMIVAVVWDRSQNTRRVGLAA